MLLILCVTTYSKLRRKTPYYRRNLPHLCSFFAKGSCNRGNSCPFRYSPHLTDGCADRRRHEMPVTGELANQNIKDRFYGVNDPVAKKMMGHPLDGDSLSGPPPPPSDRNVTTIWVGGIDEKMTESDVRQVNLNLYCQTVTTACSNVFYPYGELSSVSLVPNKYCGFITYVRRESAEEAMAALYAACEINGERVRLDWGKGGPRTGSTYPALSRPVSDYSAAGANITPAPPGVQNSKPLVYNPESTTHLTTPAVRPPPGIAPPPGMKSKAYYPSMDPKHMASKVVQ